MIIVQIFQLIYFLLIDFLLFLYYGKWNFQKSYFVKNDKGLIRQYHKSDYNVIENFKNKNKKLLPLMGKYHGGFISKYDALFKCPPMCESRLNIYVDGIYSN